MHLTSPRTIVLALGALLLLLGGWKALAALRADDEQLKFITAPVLRGPLVARVTATGSLSARVTVQVGSQVSGRIQALSADFNSTVKKGQVIARLDRQLFEAGVEQARANLAAAQGNLTRARAEAADAERQARRADELHEQKLVSQAERDTVRSNAESAQAGVAAAEGLVAQARAALSQARINLDYTVITSPTNGTVISRNVDVGQTVAASLAAPILFVIAEDLRKMQVHTSVAESDVGKLKEGMPVVFRVDAYPGEGFSGELTQIRNAPQLAQNVVTYDAVLNVDNTDLRLKPGMTANVSFITAQRQDALLVSNAALRFRPSAELLKTTLSAPQAQATAQQRTLWVLRAGLPAPVLVEVGISDGSRTEISSGELQAGNEVITDTTAAKPKTASQPTRLF
ncbi:MAG: efflux RND transporter periplasmic adaptor subunit [Pseudomonadota bacterium]